MGYRPYHTNFFGSVIYHGTRYEEEFEDRALPKEFLEDEALFNMTEWDSDINKELRPLGARFVAMFEDDGDSRIDTEGFVVLFDNYTNSTEFSKTEEGQFSDDFLDGETKGTPSKDDIALVKAVVERHGLPWYEPERERRSYVI